MLAAVILLCTKVDLTYVARSEYLFGLYFYGFLLLLIALLFVLTRQPKLWAVLPLMLCILASYVNTDGMTFLNSNLQECEANVCKAIDEEIIDQIMAASFAGQETVTIYVPVTSSPENWPHASFVGDRIANTLYKHGLLNGPIRVEVEPSLEMNRKYNLYIPETVQ
jgi:energy-coupling factor transporter transmembrane protein EcfT